MLTTDQITEIFFLADEYCILFQQHIEQTIKINTVAGKQLRNKPSGLSNSEVITILICFQLSDYRTFKHFYNDYVCVHLKTEFPTLVSYGRFIELQRLAALPLIMFVMTNCTGAGTGISFIDSTKLAVCKNQRIKQHRQFKGIAQHGHTSTGWFFGFKLHLIINDKAEIISFQLTRGNVADNNENLLISLCKKIFGKLYGDKGYLVKQSVFEKLFYDGVQLITKIKRNMKNILMSAYDKIMLRKRSVIECVMDSLKNICQIEHSRHRSLHGLLINIFAAIGAYHFLPKKPSLMTHFETEQNNQSLQLSL
jgi:Transposase DDE domain